MSEQRMVQTEVESKRIDVSFLIPVLGGKIYLGQRGTPPYEGFYGAIGGKSEPTATNHFGLEHMIIKMGGHQSVSIADQLAIAGGQEIPAETAIREFCEEMFSNREYPSDFSKNDFTSVHRIGSIDDYPKGDRSIEAHCYIHIAKVRRRKFHPSAREITDFKPLVEIEPDNIFPITMMALEHVRWMMLEGVAKHTGLRPYVKMKLEDQIPKFNIPFYRNNSMAGTMNYFAENDMIGKYRGK